MKPHHWLCAIGELLIGMTLCIAASPAAALGLTAKGESLASLPESFQMVLQADGTQFPASFQKFSNRAPNMQVHRQSDAGGLTAVATGGVATYLGTLDGNTDAVAAAVVLGDGSVLYQVVFTDGEHWINQGGATEVRRPGAFTFNAPQFVVMAGATPSGLLQSVEVGVDVPFHIYTSQYQGDSERAVRMIEYSLLGANLLYMRQAGIQHRLVRVILRTSLAQDPYAPLRSADPGCIVDAHCKFLQEVARQWNTQLPAGSEDLVLVLREVGGSGLANVASVAAPRGYSSNDLTALGDFSIVWRHEAGHNWSLGHYDGGTPEGPTMNSDNFIAKMSGPEAALVANHRAQRSTAFEDVGPLALPIAPHAASDHVFVKVSLPALDVPVLANDHDPNGGALQLQSVTRVAGGLATQASVAGNAIRIQPQSQLTNGLDVFEYRIASPSGTARGLLFVNQVNYATRYQQNFSGFADGVTDLGDGSIMTQIGGQPSVSVQQGRLELTPDLTSRFGNFTVPLLGLERGFNAQFSYNVSAAGTAADAFAFNFGQRIAAEGGPRYHGFARGVTIEFNTFEVGGYRLFINGVERDDAFVAGIIADGAWHDVEIVWANDELTLRVDSVTIFDRLSTAVFEPGGQDGLAFSARTIGLSQRVLIDDIDIVQNTTQIFMDGFEAAATTGTR